MIFVVIENWEDWMIRNHIKMWGEQSDGGPNAGNSVENISGAEVAAEMLEHAREASNRDLQELVAEGEARAKT